MHTSFLVLIILALVIVASIITSIVKAPDFVDEEHTEQESDPKDIWVVVRGKDSNTSEKIFEYWHFIYQDSRWICKERKKKAG